MTHDHEAGWRGGWTFSGFGPKAIRLTRSSTRPRGGKCKNGGQPLKEMIYVVCKVWWTETKLVRRPLHVHYNFSWTEFNWYLLKLFFFGLVTFGNFRRTISSENGRFTCFFLLQYLLCLSWPFEQYSTKYRPLCIVWWPTCSALTEGEAYWGPKQTYMVFQYFGSVLCTRILVDKDYLDYNKVAITITSPIYLYFLNK